MSPDNKRNPLTLADIAKTREPLPSKEEVLNFREELEKLLQESGEVVDLVGERNTIIDKITQKLCDILVGKGYILLYNSNGDKDNIQPNFSIYRFTDKKPALSKEKYFIDIGMRVNNYRVKLVLLPDGRFEWMAPYGPYDMPIPSKQAFEQHYTAFKQVLNSQEKK